MKKINFILLLFISAAILTSCNKESVDKQATTKTNEKKEALNQDKNNTSKEVTNSSSGNINLFKVDKVEKSSGSKSAPNFFWTE